MLQSMVMQPLKLATRYNERRNKRRAEGAPDDSGLRGSNVMYAQVDPAGEWLASVTMMQSEAMAGLQIEHSKDVAAQVRPLAHASSLSGVRPEVHACRSSRGGACKLAS